MYTSRAYVRKVNARPHQFDKLMQVLQICSNIYNKAIDLRTKYYEETGKFLSYNNLDKLIKDEYPILDPEAKVYSQVKQDTLIRNTRGYESKFRAIKKTKSGEKSRKVGSPRKKSKPSKSFTLPQKGHKFKHKDDDENKNIIGLKFWKNLEIGTLRFTQPLRLPEGAVVRTITIIKKPDNCFYISISCYVPPKEVKISKSAKILYPHDNVTTHLAEKQESIGIDFGIKDFITLSDGKTFNCSAIKEAEKKLDELKRAEKHKKRQLRKEQIKKEILKDSKFRYLGSGSLPAVSSRRLKSLRLRIAKQQMKIANIRKDFHHKVVNYLLANFKHIYIEDIDMLGLILKNEYGRKFNRRLFAAGWGKFVIILNYKSELYSSEVTTVNPAYTSQLCLCGAHAKKELKDRVHECASCGLVGGRDTVSAQVIEILGDVNHPSNKKLSEAKAGIRNMANGHCSLNLPKPLPRINLSERTN